MNKKTDLFWYGLFALAIVIIDRFSKTYALRHCVEACKVNQYISLECIYNRGIAWGILYSSHPAQFIIVSAIVASIIGIVGFHTYHAFRRGTLIIGEVMILSGAISNFFDRLFHHGVIDFIHLSYNDWSWPHFNFADFCIVIGVGIMLIQCYKES